MEEALAIAKEVFCVLGTLVDLKELSKFLPAELREVVLHADEQSGFLSLCWSDRRKIH